MRNAITEIKSTLERTNSKITEAEDRISEVKIELWKKKKDRIVGGAGSLLSGVLLISVIAFLIIY